MDIIIETPGHERQEDELYMVYTPQNFALYGQSAAAMHGTLRELLSGVDVGVTRTSLSGPTSTCVRCNPTVSMWDLEHTHVKTSEGGRGFRLSWT